MGSTQFHAGERNGNDSETHASQCSDDESKTRNGNDSETHAIEQPDDQSAKTNSYLPIGHKSISCSSAKETIGSGSPQNNNTTMMTNKYQGIDEMLLAIKGMKSNHLPEGVTQLSLNLFVELGWHLQKDPGRTYDRVLSATKEEVEELGRIAAALIKSGPPPNKELNKRVVWQLITSLDLSSICAGTPSNFEDPKLKYLLRSTTVPKECSQYAGTAYVAASLVARIVHPDLDPHLALLEFLMPLNRSEVFKQIINTAQVSKLSSKLLPPLNDKLTQTLKDCKTGFQDVAANWKDICKRMCTNCPKLLQHKLLKQHIRFIRCLFHIVQHVLYRSNRQAVKHTVWQMVVEYILPLGTINLCNQQRDFIFKTWMSKERPPTDKELADMMTAIQEAAKQKAITGGGRARQGKTNKRIDETNAKERPSKKPKATSASATTPTTDELGLAHTASQSSMPDGSHTNSANGTATTGTATTTNGEQDQALSPSLLSTSSQSTETASPSSLPDGSTTNSGNTATPATTTGATATATTTTRKPETFNRLMDGLKRAHHAAPVTPSSTTTGQQDPALSPSVPSTNGRSTHTPSPSSMSNTSDTVTAASASNMSAGTSDTTTGVRPVEDPLPLLAPTDSSFSRPLSEPEVPVSAGSNVFRVVASSMVWMSSQLSSRAGGVNQSETWASVVDPALKKGAEILFEVEKEKKERLAQSLKAIEVDKYRLDVLDVDVESPFWGDTFASFANHYLQRCTTDSGEGWFAGDSSASCPISLVKSIPGELIQTVLELSSQVLVPPNVVPPPFVMIADSGGKKPAKKRVLFTELPQEICHRTNGLALKLRAVFLGFPDFLRTILLTNDGKWITRTISENGDRLLVEYPLDKMDQTMAEAIHDNKGENGLICAVIYEPVLPDPDDGSVLMHPMFVASNNTFTPPCANFKRAVTCIYFTVKMLMNQLNAEDECGVRGKLKEFDALFPAQQPSPIPQVGMDAADLWNALGFFDTFGDEFDPAAKVGGVYRGEEKYLEHVGKSLATWIPDCEYREIGKVGFVMGHVFGKLGAKQRCPSNKIRRVAAHWAPCGLHDRQNENANYRMLLAIMERMLQYNGTNTNSPEWREWLKTPRRLALASENDWVKRQKEEPYEGLHLMNALIEVTPGAEGSD